MFEKYVIRQSAAKMLSGNISITFNDYPGMEYAQVSGNRGYLYKALRNFSVYLLLIKEEYEK